MSEDTFESVGEIAQEIVQRVDPYAFWRKALKLGGGRQLTREQAASLVIHENEPKVGFYRTRNSRGPDNPVAIWFENDKLVALEGDNPVDPVDVWSWCCRWPVSEDDYWMAREKKVWPDDPPAPPSIGHNMPTDDPHEAAKLEFEGEKEIAQDFLKKPITTQQQADQAAVWAKRLTELHNRVEKMFRAKKDPIVEEGRRVDEEFRWRQEIKELATALKRHQDAWLREQERLEQERQRKAREEAERKAREAEEARRKAEEAAMSEEERERILEEAKRKAEEAAAAEREAQARKVQSGRTGAKVSLRTYVSARIVDYDKAVEGLKDHPDMRALVEQLANRAVKAGITIPGVERVEEKRAA